MPISGVDGHFLCDLLRFSVEHSINLKIDTSIEIEATATIVSHQEPESFCSRKTFYLQLFTDQEALSFKFDRKHASKIYKEKTVGDWKNSIYIQYNT